MQKFENVDILACLDAVMKQNTGFYQSDFEIDKEIIHEAAASPDREDRTLLWLSRPSGTHCFRERGERSQPKNRYLGGSPDPQYGAFLRFEMQSNAPEVLRDLLQEERRSREQLSPGDFKAHIAALRDGLIEAEARSIVAEMKRQYSPQQPEQNPLHDRACPGVSDACVEPGR